MLFKIIKSLSEKTPLDYDIKDYAPWMVNRAFSNVPDSLFFADIMNKFSHLPDHIQRDFYLHGLPRGRRFGKWNKPPAINNNVEMLMEHYQVNRRVAESYLKVMNDEAILELKEKMREGGRK